MRGAYRLRRMGEAAQETLFSAFRMQSLLERRECRELALAMGFEGQWDEHRRFQMAFLREHGLEPGHRFLEIGSGPLTLGIPMIGYLDKGCYTGIDVRASVNDIALKQIGRNHLAGKNPRIVTSADFGATEIGEAAYDRIFSFSVLFHLTDELAGQLFARVARTLAPGGTYFGNINTDVEESEWLEFPFVRRDVGFYRDLAARHGLVLDELGPMHALGFRHEDLERNNVVIRARWP